MTKLYRVEAYVLDLNGDAKTVKDVISCIENNRHPEFITVKDVQETEIGEWSDDHELNSSGCDYEKYFPDTYPGPLDGHLKKEYQRVRTIMLQQIDRCQAAEREARSLREEIAKLKKVQEFVKTIGDLVK